MLGARAPGPAHVSRWQLLHAADAGTAIAIRDAEGPFRLSVAVRYQPIGFRWADNLRAYAAPEPQRFVRYYEAAAPASPATLARAETLVR